MQMYNLSTESKHPFFYVNLQAEDAEHMFNWNLDNRLVPSLLQED